MAMAAIALLGAHPCGLGRRVVVHDIGRISTSLRIVAATDAMALAKTMHNNLGEYLYCTQPSQHRRDLLLGFKIRYRQSRNSACPSSLHLPTVPSILAE